MQRYSFLSLARNALTGHEGWARAWRSPPLKDEYDVVIVGAGGRALHRLPSRQRARADRCRRHREGLARRGNTARNTHTIRSNYLRDVSIRFHDVSVKLYEKMSRELNYNILFSQRSMIDLIQSWGKLRDLRRRSLAMALHGPSYELVSVDEVRRRIPAMGDLSGVRLPPLAGMVHPRRPWRGTTRSHGPTPGPPTRAASRSTSTRRSQASCAGRTEASEGVETSRGVVKARRVALATAGNTSHVAARAGLTLPLVTRNLQAFVSEPVKPIIDVIVNCPDIGLYLMQSDKGEIVIGGGTDPIPSYRQGCHFATFEDVVASLVELFPRFRGLKMLRQWGGAIEFAYDASPIISATPIDGLYVSTAGTAASSPYRVGGLTFAHLIATGRPHALAEAFGLERFPALRFLLEAGTVAQR